MALELSDEQIQKLMQGISIPPQPQIMVDLQMEQFSNDCDISRIAKLISQDVGLSGSILKTINSPFFAMKNKVTSILQACTLLGIDSVVNIVNALSIRGELTDENIVQLNNFWDSAMDVAMVCTTIAQKINSTSVDEAYTVGLFHNCGIPLMMMRFENYGEVMHETYTNSESRIIDSENAHFKTNHAVVGYYVAKSWNLPKYLCDAIADHHSADVIFANSEYEKKEQKDLLAILKMAEHICKLYKTLGNQEIDIEWERIESEVLDYIGLSPEDFISVTESCQDMGLT